MKLSSIAVPAAFLSVLFFSPGMQAGENININSLAPGVKYCPAPWADNSEFLDTHYGIDAKTGVLTKYTGTVHPDETGAFAGTGEQVLYVAPPVSVENRFVPNPREPNLRPVQQSRVEPAPSRRGYPTQVRQTSRQVRSRPAASAPAPRASLQTARGESRVATAPATRQGGQNGKQPWWRGIFRN